MIISATYQDITGCCGKSRGAFRCQAGFVKLPELPGSKRPAKQSSVAFLFERQQSMPSRAPALLHVTPLYPPAAPINIPHPPAQAIQNDSSMKIPYRHQAMILTMMMVTSISARSGQRRHVWIYPAIITNAPWTATQQVAPHHDDNVTYQTLPLWYIAQAGSRY